MSGKFQICLALITSLVLGTAWLPLKADAAEHAVKTAFKENLRIKGYWFTNLGPNELKGLREKAKADYYYNQGRLADAIRHYEQASKMLPEEADIYYNLGSVYYSLSVFNTASRYFHVAAEKYPLPVNTGKTQKYRYRSLIYEGISLEKSRYINEDNHAKAESILADLMKEEKLIRQDYPEVTNELRVFSETVFGKTRVNVVK